MLMSVEFAFKELLKLSVTGFSQQLIDFMRLFTKLPAVLVRYRLGRGAAVFSHPVGCFSTRIAIDFDFIDLRITY